MALVQDQVRMESAEVEKGSKWVVNGKLGSGLVFAGCGHHTIFG